MTRCDERLPADVQWPDPTQWPGLTRTLGYCKDTMAAISLEWEKQHSRGVVQDEVSHPVDQNKPEPTESIAIATGWLVVLGILIGLKVGRRMILTFLG